MMKLRAKTIVRRLSAFALCASLSLSLVSAHAADAAHPTTAEETAVAADAVMASLPYGFLSASCETVVDSVGTTEDIQDAKEQLAEEARAAEEAAKAAAEAEAKAAAAAARLTTLRTAAVTPRAISKSSALKADSVIRENTKKLGSFRLSFYCPRATCNGRSDAKTKIGTRMAEGRTIAVDSRIIPLGSRVYIDGYGVFIAEDTGGAIKGNRIDVCVSSHSRAYQFGIDHADVYLIG